MATILDIGLLNYFYVIFPFLLIYAVTLGLLTWLKIFGDNKLIYNIIAITLAFISVLSDTLVQVINMAVPWFVVIFTLLIFLVIAYKFLGAKDSDIANVLTRDKTIVVWILIIFILIIFGSVAKIYFSQEQAATTGGGITVSESEIGTRGVTSSAGSNHNTPNSSIRNNAALRRRNT